MTLTVGQEAPNFTLLSDENIPISLKNLRGKKIILYFYPKDHTPGCTLESCNFRDKIEKFQKLNTVILGISRDSVDSHARFKSNFRLPFSLLSDSTAEVCQAYGVLADKSLFGKKYKGIERTTYLIDEKGIIQAIWPKVKVLKHVREVLNKIGDI